MEPATHPGGSRQPKLIMTHTQMAASLLLQMLLYYSGLFSLMWGIITACIMAWKWDNLDDAPVFQYITMVVFVIWAVVEPLRIWFGFVGNLKEKVPQLAAHCLLNVFPQIPVLIYLAAFQPSLLPFERVANVIQLLLVIVSAGVGFATTRSLVRNQTSQFYLNQFEADGVDGAEPMIPLTAFGTPPPASSEPPARSASGADLVHSTSAASVTSADTAAARAAARSSARSSAVPLDTLNALNTTPPGLRRR
ncbi:transmembrane protein 17 [Thecamonas trahens ATCC 50062]|uniref:Transmembrane protein 17 n=1 Tax=Thecamonas trahens ATCC 50062 TaxID=461836 RepID=A0A0L0D7S4_THETB|nr:transmembrane protein 17 [Thecamonas trahens ATCC 50062]KNC47358.1 transmembrane protein 17 [Thecamonas trahens ATCC 50062]|eukprot:XP_013759696.1 transmembrane protein 17 [Thecamonas trahens ATCC 50062]